MKFALVNWSDNVCNDVHVHIVAYWSKDDAESMRVAIYERLATVHGLPAINIDFLKTEHISSGKAWTFRDQYKILLPSSGVQWDLPKVCNICGEFKPNSLFCYDNKVGKVCESCYPKVNGGRTMEEDRQASY